MIKNIITNVQTEVQTENKTDADYSSRPTVTEKAMPPFSPLPDTVFKLNRSDSSEPGAVNKFAAAEAKTVNKSSDIAKTLPSVKAVPGRMPHRSSRSLCCHPARVYRRKPAERRGPVPKAYE